MNEAQPEIVILRQPITRDELARNRKMEIESTEIREAVRALTLALIGDGAAL